jgi:AraC-like DNA-binding protein
MYLGMVLSCLSGKRVTMTARPDGLTETPDRKSAQLLQDVLRMIHLSGSLILRAEFTTPWAYRSPASEQLKSILKPGSTRMILFHMIPEGHCVVDAGNGERVELQGGDLVILPYADQHVAGSPDGPPPVPVNEILPPQPWSGLPVVRYGGGGPVTQMVCGYLECEDLLFNPFLRALPRLFKVRPPEGPTSEWVRATVRFALEGATADAAHRLFELIFVEAMRLYAQSLPQEQTGWLAALADPVVGRALAQLHAAPAERWTVDELARRVATSRSVLDDRFRRQLGRAPMRYLSEWRLQLAADLLRTTTLGVAEVAGRVGYEAEAAFNRAFRRALGEPPARWRDQQLERRRSS